MIRAAEMSQLLFSAAFLIDKRGYMMEIRKTKMADLEQVLAIYERARGFMAAHGNPNQWKNTEPPKETVVQDIFNENSYVCVDSDEIAAVFYFVKEEDPTYAVIYDGSWPNDKAYGVVHRIASAGKVKGAGAFCLNWAYEQCKNLRIDTHKDNIVMQNLLEKLGFQYCGIIHLKNGEERLAYQK